MKRKKKAKIEQHLTACIKKRILKYESCSDCYCGCVFVCVAHYPPHCGSGYARLSLSLPLSLFPLTHSLTLAGTSVDRVWCLCHFFLLVARTWAGLWMKRKLVMSEDDDCASLEYDAFLSCRSNRCCCCCCCCGGGGGS